MIGGLKLETKEYIYIHKLNIVHILDIYHLLKIY